jgi:hypothetical protein
MAVAVWHCRCGLWYCGGPLTRTRGPPNPFVCGERGGVIGERISVSGFLRLRFCYTAVEGNQIERTVPGVRPARGRRAPPAARPAPARRVGRARPGARGRGPRGAAPPRLRHPRGTIARVKRGKRKAANAGRRVTSEQLSARESCGQTAVPVGPARRVLDVLYSVLSVLEVTVNGISRISHLADSIDAPSGRMCGRRLRSCILWTPLLALCWRLKTRHSSSDIAAA